MNVELQPVAAADKAVLRELLNLYLYDLSALAGTGPDAHGRFEYPYLDHYFTEPDRHAFFILADGARAGFVLVNARTETGAERCIAEFFVLRRLRRARVGSAAAARVFERLRGSWEVCTDANNAAAAPFWRAVVESFTGGAFEQRPGTGGWTGPMFVFDNGGAA
jgi:predicted acetyltransferase